MEGNLFDTTTAATSLVSLLSRLKCNNILKLPPHNPTCPLIPHYLRQLWALQVKQKFYRTLLSMWIRMMPSISALGAA
jgi:hypothetical protein